MVQSEHSLTVNLVDGDGDRLDFLISEAGLLEEYCNDVRALGHVASLRYDYWKHTIDDGSGSFSVQTAALDEKLLLLHVMAFIADVDWLGDMPALTTVRCRPVDMLRRLLESHTKHAQLHVADNISRIELVGITERGITLRINESDINLEVDCEERVLKAGVLEYFAKKARIEWVGKSLIPNEYVTGKLKAKATPRIKPDDQVVERLQEVTVTYISGDIVGTFGLSDHDHVSLLRRQVEHAVGESVRLFYQERILKDRDVLRDVLPSEDALVYLTTQITPTFSDDVVVMDAGEMPTNVRSVRTRIPTGFVNALVQE